MSLISSEIYRIDPLTGCENFLSFVEALNNLTYENKGEEISILYTDMNGLARINDAKGNEFGNSVLRWMGITLKEVTQAEVFRIGNDDFAAILECEKSAISQDIVADFVKKLERGTSQFGLPTPIAGIVLINYKANQNLNPVMLFSHMGHSMLHMKKNRNQVVTTFNGNDLPQSSLVSQNDWRQHTDFSNPEWLVHLALSKVIDLGKKIDEINQAAYTDLVTGLPNMRDAVNKFETEFNKAHKSNHLFSILLMDGDNLRIYNKDNYAEGDMMLRDLSTLIKSQLRPEDYVARWRSGDEFIALLPGANIEAGIKIAERIRIYLKEESKSWKYPITISIGIASFPDDGLDFETLINISEKALKTAKENGKDCVVSR